MSKIILCNWNHKEWLGGQESFFGILSQILNAKRISYSSCENVLRKFLFKGKENLPIYQGYVIEYYLKLYEELFGLDLIIKNSGVGGQEILKTPQIVVFQDPFYSIQRFLINKKIFSSGFWRYNASIDLQRRTANQALKTVAVSNFMKKDMKLNDIRCDEVIEEGIDVERFKPFKDKEALKKAHGLPLDKKIGIAVTKFIFQKGWSMLAELINNFPDIHWIVILTEKIGTKPKLKNVTLVEQVLPNLMSRFYNCADFFISTSPVESFGLSPCEAASCDLPIIVYNTGIFWDWFDSKLGVRVDKWDYREFEKAVKEIKDSDLKEFSPRQALIKRGLTKEVMGRNWKEFIEKIKKKE